MNMKGEGFLSLLLFVCKSVMEGRGHRTADSKGQLHPDRMQTWAPLVACKPGLPMTTVRIARGDVCTVMDQLRNCGDCSEGLELHGRVRLEWMAGFCSLARPGSSGREPVHFPSFHIPGHGFADNHHI